MEKFILRTNQFYKILDNNFHDRILKIRFEDLVLNYEETKKEIEEFLCLTEENHISKFKYFNPLQSNKNVMIWKKIFKSITIEKIKNEINYFEYKDY